MRTRADKRAFSLVEIMTVLVIIALAAALIVPALIHYQSKAGLTACMSKGKAIAQALRTYASENNGFTPTDEDYYVALMGYRVDYPWSAGTSWETKGYFGEPADWASDTSSQSYQHAQTINDFTCPVDGSPDTNLHGCKSSYRVGSAFRGGRSFGLFERDTIVVSERRNVHQTDEGDARLYVYGNGASEFAVHAVPGLWCRGWNTSMGDWNAIKNSPYPNSTYLAVPELEMEWTRDFDVIENQFIFLPTRDRFAVAIQDWTPSANVQNPCNIILRWDGEITVSHTGNWRLRLYASDYRYLWIDQNQNESVDTNETRERTYRDGVNQYVERSFQLQTGERYRFTAMYGVGGNTQNSARRRFRYEWYLAAAGTSYAPSEMFHDAQ